MPTRLASLRLHRLLPLLAVPLLLGACGVRPPASIPAPTTRITTAEELVGAMRARYDSKWFRTITFVQRNTRYLADGRTEPSTWLEAISLPGKLRIDIEPRANQDGVLFVRDTQYVVQGGKVVSTTPGAHPLLLLGFDVYFLPIDRTLGALRTLGFDLSTMHEAEWEGRPVYVVGAERGDLHTRQFWIDRERLLFVRLLEPSRRDSTKTSEVRFLDYAPYGGGWVAPRVDFLLDGRPVFREDYEDVRIDVELDPALFDPARWTTARFWR